MALNFILCDVSISISDFLRLFFFQSSFRITAKVSGMYRDFPYILCLPTYIASPIINIPHQSGTYVKIDKPTLMHHYLPKPVVYIRVHSCWCTFYGFGQMYSQLCIIQNIFTASKIFCAPSSYPSLSPTLGKHLFFYYLHSFFSLQMSYHWNHSGNILFRLDPYTQ